MWRLFYPLRYFRLLNNEKRHVDAWPTLALAVVIALPYILIPGASFFRGGGFLDKLILLTSALTGFYVAALVAAATFSHPDLDKTISIGAVALIRRGADGKRVQELLSRREFACTIFGYLAFATLMVSLFSAIFISIGGVNLKPLQTLKWVGAIFTPAYFHFVRGLFVIAFSLAVANITVVTSLGLYYLMDRLYRREPRVTTKKADKAERVA